MAGWQESLIMPDVSIREAMRAIDTASLRMAFIVSDEKCLLGTITDGDIRRGLLKNLNMMNVRIYHHISRLMMKNSLKMLSV